MRLKKSSIVTALVFTGIVFCYAQEAPVGAVVDKTPQEQKALDALKGTVNGKIVWSTSRARSKHDIWICNADGTDPKPLTSSPNNVDWFSRFSPDGAKVCFVRSKMGWVSESEADVFDKWDIWTINADGTDEKKVVENACWGTWRPAGVPSGDTLVFARGAKVFEKCLTTGEEKEIFDAETQFKKGTFSQQPELSPNGKLLAITLRGTSRQTGIWNFEKKVWYTTGGGCQITWLLPSSQKVIRMNEGQGNGGTEVLAIDLNADGKPTENPNGLAIPQKWRFMDLPGRRSHEYFPQVDKSGGWMVWCATQYGHEHDIVDYEMYIWKVGTDQKNAVRLTFHSGNDRWPDIILP